MDLKKAISVLNDYADSLPEYSVFAAVTAASSFMETVRVITPFDTGDLSDDWDITEYKATANGATVKVSTNPIHRDYAYASRIEKYYRHKTGPGDRNSLDFHRRTEALYKLKADDIIQEYLETSLKQSL